MRKLLLWCNLEHAQLFSVVECSENSGGAAALITLYECNNQPISIEISGGAAVSISLRQCNIFLANQQRV